MISVLMPIPAISPLSAPQAAHLFTQHRESSHTDKMLPALCSLFTALSCVSGVTVVTQKPPVLTPTKGETTTMHCNLGTVTNSAAYWYKQVPGEAPQHPIPALSPLSAPQAAHLLTQHRESSHTDKMLPALCSLFTALSCVSGVTVVTQKPPVLTPTKGETTTMHCNLGTVTGSAARWYKLVAGEAPQYVISNRHSWSSPSYGSGFSSPKFTSTCSSNSDCSVIISNVELIPALSPLCAPQAAHLFTQHRESSHTDKMLPALCSLFTALSSKKMVSVSEGMDRQASSLPVALKLMTSSFQFVQFCTVVFGQGTKLIVTDSAVPAPVLTIFPPSSEVLKSNKATLVCLANDVSSGFADVRWLVDGKAVSSGVTTGSAAQQPNKKFRLSSYLTIERSEWDKDKAITCEVSAASKATTKEIKKSECSD
ncbi:hypothetical protein SRHO_G00198890 [Serrasalmus rhombeus]